MSGAASPSEPPSAHRSPARVAHPVLESVNDRVEYIADLMRADRWHTRRTKLELASTWGVAESTVQNYSAEAGRTIADAIQERRASIAHRAIDRLENLAKDCAASGVPGDAGAAAKANELLLKVAGFAEPEEDKNRPTTIVQVGQVVASPVFSGLMPKPRQLNGHSNGTANDGSAETIDHVPVADRNGKLV